jgi:hypothetical protein
MNNREKPQCLNQARASCQSKGDNINATAVFSRAVFECAI